MFSISLFKFQHGPSALDRFSTRASLGALVLALLTCVSAQSQAQVQQPLTLKEAVQKAVLNNPEILARWHTLKAAEGERDAGAGAYLPKVDLLSGLGRDRRTDSVVRSPYDRTSSSLTITQLLYDGFTTRNEVKRLGHARLVRLFEFFDNSENVALEAARAYYDVLRHRELVRLAEDNFVQHRTVLDQTERKVNAKVARPVDLDQVLARVALAEANLLTDNSNLHDVTARFQRIVGQLPTQEMPSSSQLAQAIPVDAVSAIRDAQQRNGALLASVENVYAANAALVGRRGAFHPRIDLRVRGDQGTNLLGVPGRSTAGAAEVVMTWNLFNGNSDRAREVQFAEQLNVAKDLRDKTCRDISQTLMIAYNDTRRLKEQMGLFKKNLSAMVTTRKAYLLQFNIGERTLLNMLDSENELFAAKRAVANVEQDINIAYVRTHAVLGTLLTALELSRIDTDNVRELEQGDERDDDVRQCPVEVVPVYFSDKDALIIKAKNIPKQTALPDYVSYSELRRALQNWRAAWSQRYADGYLASYVPDFVPDSGGDTNVWKARSRAFLARSSDIVIGIDDLSVTLTDATRPSMVFKQTYRSEGITSVVTKTLQWVRVGDRWLIARESSNTSEPIQKL